MDIRIESGDGILRIILTGSLGFSENPQFRAMVDGLVEGDQPVVLDLGAVDRVDSAGLGLLLVARERATRLGRRLTLAHAGGQVARMLELAKFTDLFAIEASGAQV